MLLGEDPLPTERLWSFLYGQLHRSGIGGINTLALGAIDIALWDIKGKFLDQPIHRLMGGPIRSRVPAYATGLYRRRRDDHVEYLAEEAAGYVAEGFGAVKLKVGFGVDEDARAVRAVRQAIGSDVQLMLDANHAFDAVAAIRLGQMVEDQDIGWFEEPVPPEDHAGYLRIREALQIPIAGGESEFTRYGMSLLFARNVIDIVQPDICAAGGLSECKKIADLAMIHGIRCTPHVWGTGIAIAAALQFLAVTPAFTPPSLSPVEPIMEFDRTEHPMRQAILTEPIEHRNGVVEVPTGPGLGIEIDRDALERFGAS